jgi:HEAT repeat protein
MRELLLACLCGTLFALPNRGLAGPLEKRVEAAIKALKTQAEAQKRAEAAMELADLGSIKTSLTRPAVPALVEAFRADSDPGVRVAAAGALAVIEPDPKEVLPVSMAVLKNGEEDKAIRTAAVGILAGLGKGARPALPLLKEIQKAENDKPENERIQELLNAVNEAIGLIEAD